MQGVDPSVRKFLEGLRSDGNEDVADLNPDFAARLMQLIQAGAKAGVDLRVNSGFRSPEYQQALRNKNPAAAAAGMIGTATGSRHTKGLAVDLADASGRKMTYDSPGGKFLREHAADFGLNVPMQPGKSRLNEPWHVEPLSARASTDTAKVSLIQQAAKSGPQYLTTPGATGGAVVTTPKNLSDKQQSFYDEVAPFALKVVRSLGGQDQMAPVIMTQWALESDYGTKRAAPNNLAGLGGPGHWHSYSSLDGFADEVISTLKNKRYAGFREALKGTDVSQAVYELGNSGWDLGKYMEHSKTPVPGINLLNFMKRDGMTDATVKPSNVSPLSAPMGSTQGPQPWTYTDSTGGGLQPVTIPGLGTIGSPNMTPTPGSLGLGSPSPVAPPLTLPKPGDVAPPTGGWGTANPLDTWLKLQNPGAVGSSNAAEYGATHKTPLTPTSNYGSVNAAEYRQANPTPPQQSYGAPGDYSQHGYETGNTPFFGGTAPTPTTGTASPPAAPNAGLTPTGTPPGIDWKPAPLTPYQVQQSNQVGYSAGQAAVTPVDKTPGLLAMALAYLANHPVASQHTGPANIYYNHDTGKFEVEPLGSP